MTTATTNDYIKLAKEYKATNQKTSLWDQFLTGQQNYFKAAAQQVSDVASYDISQAYANYKQQQLQLQMADQLGTGFKEQVGSQLQAGYNTAYQGIKADETSALANVASQYTEAIEAGEESFAKMGQQLKTYDKLIHEFAEANEIAIPENAFTKSVDASGVVTTELTDYGRLWYNDVLNAITSEGLNFDKWLLSDASSSTISLEDREAVLQEYRQNPELFREQVTGLTPDFDAAATRTRLDTEERQAAWSTAETTGADTKALTQVYGDEFANITPDDARKVQTNIERNENYVSTLDHRNGKNGDVVEDEYGNKWRLWGYNLVGEKARELGKSLGIVDDKGYITDTNKYKTGDVIYVNGNYYVIEIKKGAAFLSGREALAGIRQLAPGDYSYEGAVRPLF